MAKLSGSTTILNAEGASNALKEFGSHGISASQGLTLGAISFAKQASLSGGGSPSAGPSPT
jgi:hypothetical protein